MTVILVIQNGHLTAAQLYRVMGPPDLWAISDGRTEEIKAGFSTIVGRGINYTV